MLSFVLSKAGALTAAAILGLGGLGAYALASVPDPEASAAGKPNISTEVVHRTRHVQGPPREAAANSEAGTAGLVNAAESESVPSPAPASAPVAMSMADEGEEYEAGDDEEGDVEAGEDDGGDEELGDD